MSVTNYTITNKKMGFLNLENNRKFNIMMLYVGFFLRLNATKGCEEENKAPR